MKARDSMSTLLQSSVCQSVFYIRTAFIQNKKFIPEQDAVSPKAVHSRGNFWWWNSNANEGRVWNVADTLISVQLYLPGYLILQDGFQGADYVRQRWLPKQRWFWKGDKNAHKPVEDLLWKLATVLQFYASFGSMFPPFLNSKLRGVSVKTDWRKTLSV